MVYMPPGVGNTGVNGADGYDKPRNVAGVWDISNQQLGKGVWIEPRMTPIQNYHLAQPRRTPPFDTVQQTYPKTDNSKDRDPATHIGSAEENGMAVAGPAVYTYANKAGRFGQMVFTKDHWITGIVPEFNPSPSLGGPTAKRIFGDNF